MDHDNYLVHVSRYIHSGIGSWERPDFLPSFPPPTFHPFLFSPSLVAATQLERGPGGSLPSKPAGTLDSGEIRSAFARHTLAPGHVPGLLPPPPAFGCTQRSV